MRTVLQRLLDCPNKIKRWMASTVLKMNKSKMEILNFGSPDIVKNVVGHFLIMPNLMQRIWALLDPGFKFHEKTNVVVKSSFH